MGNLKTHFYDEADHLSNFYYSPFVWRGKEWMTAEHAYQAAKFLETDPALAQAIFDTGTPTEAKAFSIAHREQRESHWSEKKLAVMEDILRAKLNQDNALQEMLVLSGDRELIEDSPEDRYWGSGLDGSGENYLGRLWMKLRSELLSKGLRDGKLQ